MSLAEIRGHDHVKAVLARLLERELHEGMRRQRICLPQPRPVLRGEVQAASIASL